MTKEIQSYDGWNLLCMCACSQYADSTKDQEDQKKNSFINMR